MQKTLGFLAVLVATLVGSSGRALAVGADGNAFEWQYANLKHVDAHDDEYMIGDGEDGARDLIAFYYVENSDNLVMRIDVKSLDQNSVFGARYWICMKYAPNGTYALPDLVRAQTDLCWNLAIGIEGTATSNVVAQWSDFSSANSLVQAVYWYDEDGMVEVQIAKPPSFPSGGTVTFNCFSVKPGDALSGDSAITDDMVDPDRGFSTGWLHGQFTSNDQPGTAKVGFLNHGNQGLGYTDVLRGSASNPNGSGYDKVLSAHDTYNVHGSFDISGLLISAAQWQDPAWNQWIKSGVDAGRYEVVGSTVGQNIMPFFEDDMNSWAIGRTKQMDWDIYNYQTHSGWVPERCWDYAGAAGVAEWIGGVWGEQFIDGVVGLDPDTVGQNAWNQDKIYQIDGGPQCIFRDVQMTGDMHAGDWGDPEMMFVDLARDPDQQQIKIYSDDWEMAAEMDNWGAVMPNALSCYWTVVRYVGAHPFCQSTKLDTARTWGWALSDVALVGGCEPSIGGTSGYGGTSGEFGRNSWYNHWAAQVPYNVTNNKNYGTLWNDAHYAITHAPANNFALTAWHTLMTNLYETGWHDYLGGPISGWEIQYSNHIKNACVHASAAVWLGESSKPTQAFMACMDDSGNNQLVLENDKMMAVFMPTGGRLCWLFDSTGNVVMGNDMAFWCGTDGDYNDQNHIAGLSDVWDGTRDWENTNYTITINQSSGSTVSATLTAGKITKVVSLSTGDNYLTVKYTVPTTTTVSSGFSPGLQNLLEAGNVLTRVWDSGSNGGYAGYQNPNTGTIGAVIAGTGVNHCAAGSTTLLEWDQYQVPAGTSTMMIYAGPGTTTTLSTLEATIR
jgi:hypothetical protein